MKVIDLLNKIANGEEFPNIIKYKDIVFDYKKEKGDYESEGEQFFLDWVDLNKYGLNDEIEIIEEDKKIEKVNTYVLCDRDFESMGKHSTKATEIIDKAFEEYSHKINEIIDYLEEKDNGSSK